MSKKKLLHIQLLPLLSGVQNIMLELLAELKDEYDIYVICKPGGPLVDAIQESGYHYIPVSSLRRNLSLWDIPAMFTLIHIIRKHRFDIVHTHSSKPGFLGRFAAYLAGTKKIVHTVHGYAFNDFHNDLVNRFYMLLEKFVSRFCDHIVYVNDFERKLAIQEKIVKPGKAKTIYNTVDIERFKMKENKYLSERDYSIQPFTIGSVFRFDFPKNAVKTIKTAVSVCKKSKDIQFIFMGDGKDFSECKQLVDEANLNMQIQLTGWHENVSHVLPELDVFLLYSLGEGLPISILEAMACGLPIVSSNVKGSNELVDETNGILVPIDDEKKLEEELLKLPECYSELETWSKNSRKKVETVFNKDRFINQYREVYES